MATSLLVNMEYPLELLIVRGSVGLDCPLRRNIASRRVDFPLLFFPKNRLIFRNPSMWACRMPLKFWMSIDLNIVIFRGCFGRHPEIWTASVCKVSHKRAQWQYFKGILVWGYQVIVAEADVRGSPRGGVGLETRTMPVAMQGKRRRMAVRIRPATCSNSCEGMAISRVTISAISA